MIYSGVSHVPVTTAAKTMNISKQRVYQLLYSGELLGVELDGVRLVSQRAIEDYLFLQERKKAQGVKK